MGNDSLMATSSTAQRLDAALAYIRRGWPVIVLHDVSMGFCSCGSGEPDHNSKGAGKHPLARAWSAAGVTDEEIIRSLFAGRPGMNIGILTGTRSGIWVFDVDPKNGGDKRLAELISEYGELPYTYTVRTGSGGVHYYWLLPHDFTPTNGRGTLPAGLDVRGEGGQVVAPPSVSAIGAYEVLADVEIVQAPAWLLDMIRPRVPFDVEHRAALAQMTSPQVATIGDRGQRYAMAAVTAELTRLRDAVPGTRGSTAFQVACNLTELLNSPWAGLDAEQVEAWYAAAAGDAMRFGGAFNAGEAHAAWLSAGRKVGARGRAAPDSALGGGLLGSPGTSWVPPFPSGPINVTEWSQGNSHAIPTDGNLIPTFGNFPGQGPGSDGNLVGIGGNPVPTQDQSSANPGDEIDALISEFLDLDGVAALPPPSWLIDGWIQRDSLCWIIGKPNDGKSFVVLDMVMCVASGKDWHGFKVEAGGVGFIAAEGVSGMGQRATAWMKTHGAELGKPNIRFLPRPVQAADVAAWDKLIIAVARMGLKVVVLDTQARVTVGLNENDPKDMSLFVEQAERLRRATGATVILVHHTPKNGTSARGHSSLNGAASTELLVSRNATMVTVSMTKQKDARYAEPITLQLLDVVVGKELDNGWYPGRDIVSATLTEIDITRADEWRTSDAKGRVAIIVATVFPNRGATKAEARAESKKLGISDSTFYRVWDQLLGEGTLAVAVIDDKATGRYVKAQHSHEIPIDQLAVSDS